MPRSFPLALKLEGKKCLVIGVSLEAAQRAVALADAGAVVHVVAEEPCPELAAAVSARSLVHHARAYEADDLSESWLAVLADRDTELAARIAADAERARVFFCAVDIPEHASFSHMAIARAGVVTFAISTEGQAPALGRRLREELQRIIDEAELAAFATELAELRRRTPNDERRSVLGERASSLVFDGKLRLRRQ